MNKVMPENRPATFSEASDEIDLVAVGRKLLAQWRVIAGCIASAGVAAVLVLHSLNYMYTAKLVVTPSESSPQESSSLQGLSGLASIAGISLPTRRGTSPYTLYVLDATSRNVADAMATHQDIMRRIFEDEWDPRERRFVHHTSLLEHSLNWVRSLLGLPAHPWIPPNGARLQSYLVDKVKGEQSTQQPIFTFYYHNPDPKFAVDFLGLLNRTIDAQVRKNALARVNENIAYLSQQLQTVTVAEQRQAIIQTLSEQEKARMMASSSAPFAAELVDVPTASLYPTSPNPVFVVSAMLFAGLFIGVVAALGWHTFGVQIETWLSAWKTRIGAAIRSR